MEYYEGMKTVFIFSIMMHERWLFTGIKSTYASDAVNYSRNSHSMIDGIIAQFIGVMVYSEFILIITDNFPTWQDQPEQIKTLQQLGNHSRTDFYMQASHLKRSKLRLLREEWNHQVYWYN